MTAQYAHDYTVDTALCFCSQADAFNAMRKYSAPQRRVLLMRKMEHI